MLGHFVYSNQPSDTCMVIEMHLKKGEPIGVLHVPPLVSQLLEGSAYEDARSGESLALPIALGLGIILSALTDTDFVLTGDRSAWKTTWGGLKYDFKDVELRLRSGADVFEARTKRLVS
jgi:hypothetical protein